MRHDSGACDPDDLCAECAADEARPFDLAWARSLRDQCRAAGVPIFVKQWGARPTLDGSPVVLRDSHGGDMAEWQSVAPDLMIREFPR